MEKERKMKQHFAISKDGLLVHIKEANQIDEDFFCPYCGCRMLKKCGAVREWHFAHDYRYENEIQKECSYESYLHAFAKLRLKQWFEESKQIILHYKQKHVCKLIDNCIWMKKDKEQCYNYKDEMIDLKQKLTKCTVEKTIQANGNSFRVDLLWSNPNNPNNNILVEIKVTHECTQEKKNSKARIIEFDVRSEEDVDRIINSEIQESKKIRYYGFEPQDIKDEEIQPHHILYKFILFKNGYVSSNHQCTCQEFLEREKFARLEITCNSENSPIEPNVGQQYLFLYNSLTTFKLYNWGLAASTNMNLKIKNCCMCRYKKPDTYNGKLKCKLKKIDQIKASEALQCSSFCIDNNIYIENLTEFKIYSKYNKVDIWENE
jgi:hypothetical protein